MHDATWMSRREFGSGTLKSLLAWSLLETLAENPASGAGTVPFVARWLKEMNELSEDVQGQRISQVLWQQKIEDLLKQVELKELLESVRFDELVRNAKPVEAGALTLRPKFPEVEGWPKSLIFGRQIFALGRERSIVPHGHNNMATAFLVLRGELHGRHYDRVEDEAEHLIIRPTIDRSFGPGETSSVSDYRDNIHWFRATSEQAYVFNLHVLDCRPGSALPTGRVYVDPQGEPLRGGLVRARRIGYQQAHTLFG